MTMNNQETWQRASLGTFEINKKGPYLERDLSVSSTQQSYEQEQKNGYEDGLRQAQETLTEYKKTLETIFSSFDGLIFKQQAVEFLFLTSHPNSLKELASK